MVRRYEHSWLYLMRHFEVPVIVVFTKYQFLRNNEIHLLDYPNKYPDSNNVSEVAEKQFQEHYPLGEGVRYVQLESGFESNARVTRWCSLAEMHRQNRCCDELVEKMASGLNENLVELMLLALAKG
jgi:hypothetical protein